jgi:hypothetical protein
LQPISKIDVQVLNLRFEQSRKKGRYVRLTLTAAARALPGRPHPDVATPGSRIKSDTTEVHRMTRSRPNSPQYPTPAQRRESERRHGARELG